MHRDLNKLQTQEFDVIVVGGGITGASIARDATMRGFSVALVEARDFGGATSSNSLKTVHGGLRYLQDLKPGLIRKMVHERRAMLRVAPHLVHPLPVVMPSYRNSVRFSKLALGAAIKLNDWISYDRNEGLDAARMLPRSRVLSRREVLRHLPGLASPQLSGGVCWYDAQLYDSERFVLAVLQSAVLGGAIVANYVTVNELLRQGRTIIGIRSTDKLSGETVDVRGRLVINASGPWLDEILSGVTTTPRRRFLLSTALNLVTRQIAPTYAVGLRSQYSVHTPGKGEEQRERVLFMAPWRSCSLIGTIHEPHDGSVHDRWMTKQMVDELLAEVNAAYPKAQLEPHDVRLVHQGFLPRAGEPFGNTVRLMREGTVIDHASEDAVEGLVSVIGVKYTTARYVAERAIDLAGRKLERDVVPCQTHQQPIHGGDMDDFDGYVAQMKERWPVSMSSSRIERLIRSYGTSVQQLWAYFEDDVAWSRPVSDETDVTQAEVVHAMRSEWAATLSDVVLRRTGMGSVGCPTASTLEACARLMAQERSWGKARIQQEIEDVQATYRLDSTSIAGTEVLL